MKKKAHLLLLSNPADREEERPGRAGRALLPGPGLGRPEARGVPQLLGTQLLAASSPQVHTCGEENGSV